MDTGVEGAEPRNTPSTQQNDETTPTVLFFLSICHALSKNKKVRQNALHKGTKLLSVAAATSSSEKFVLSFLEKRQHDQLG